MEEERDIVVFADDDGNEYEFDVVDYFEHEGQQYVVLVDFSQMPDCDCEKDDCECGDPNACIMRVVMKDDVEDLEFPEDELLDTLWDIAEKRAEEFEEGEEEE